MKQEFAARVVALGLGITVVEFEPAKLPKLPAVTMLFVSCDQEDVETGPPMYVSYGWRINVYVPLGDHRSAQETLETLVPQILSVIRPDSTWDGACEQSQLRDEGGEMIFNAEEAYASKSLRLIASLSEP